MADRILELKHITKTFPGVRALEDVHFDLYPGEIHALVGENGAGKSTFIKVITGVHQPDAGQILLDGRPVEIHGPADSQRLGIAAIYQHVTCYPDLSVTENIFIGHEKVHRLTRRIDWKELHRQAGELLAKLDADFDPRSTMGNLSVAQQQMVEIAKALSANARIIIMDEPRLGREPAEPDDPRQPGRLGEDRPDPGGGGPRHVRRLGRDRHPLRHQPGHQPEPVSTS